MAHMVPVLHILLLWPMRTPKFQNAEAHCNQKGAPQAQTRSPAEALLVTYHQREVLQNISCDPHSSSRGGGGGGRRRCCRRRRGRGRGCGRRCPLGTWNDCTSPRYWQAHFQEPPVSKSVLEASGQCCCAASSCPAQWAGVVLILWVGATKR